MAKLTYEQEMTMVFLESKTHDRAMKQFNSDKRISPINSREMSLRLIKVADDQINLETRIYDDEGSYFMPIGFFNSDGSKILLFRFYNELNYLIEMGYCPKDHGVGRLSFEQNALIAAFSMHVLRAVNSYEEVIFINANGLRLKLEIDESNISIAETMIGYNDFLPYATYFLPFGRSSVGCIANESMIFLKNRRMLSMFNWMNNPHYWRKALNK